MMSNSKLGAMNIPKQHMQSHGNIKSILENFTVDKPDELKRALMKEFSRTNDLVSALADRIKWLEQNAPLHKMKQKHNQDLSLTMTARNSLEIGVGGARKQEDEQDV